MRDDGGRQREIGDPLRPTDDAKIQYNSLQLAFDAAIALGVGRDNIHALVIREDLLPEKFNPTNAHEATIDALRRVFDELAHETAPEEDALLFVAVNHCSVDGLATAHPVDEFDEESPVLLVTPKILGECLDRVPCPQVIVVSTCHAGIFLELASQQRTVLVACDAQDVYLVPREHCAWPVFLDELFGAWCACAFSDSISKQSLPLQDAFRVAADRIAANTSGKACAAANRPQCAGTLSWPSGSPGG